MKFFKEACEINNYITIDQKIDYLLHLKNNLILNKSKSEKKSKYIKYLDSKINSDPIPQHTPYRRKGQLGETGDFQSPIHDATNGFNQANSGNVNPEIQTFYENRDENRSNSEVANLEDQHVPPRKTNTHKATISFNIQHKYLIDLKNKFKIPDDIAENYKMQIDLENYYTDLLTKIKLSKKQTNESNKIPQDNYQASSSFEKIKTFLNTKELSLEKVIVRECEISGERFLYMMGKKAFDFRTLQVI
jgi:hypothetical protein